MPVAVKFSERFYEKFGHDLTDEFVTYLNQIDSSYRSELRELNELNFARFDAKLEQRVAELGHVDADLMGASRFQPQPHERKIIVFTQHLVMRDGMPPPFDNRHLLPRAHHPDACPEYPALQS